MLGLYYIIIDSKHERAADEWVRETAAAAEKKMIKKISSSAFSRSAGTTGTVAGWQAADV